MTTAVNGRFRRQPQSGVQRYAGEIADRLSGHVRMVAPPIYWKAEGFLGHAWEQVALPSMTRGELLWSPCNTGPVIKGDQVLTVHDLATLDHPEWFAPRFAAFYRWLLPKLIPRVRAVICVSAFTRSRLTARWPAMTSRTAVVSPGISPRFTRPELSALTQRLAELGLEPNAYVLCLASFEPRKNHARLLEAWHSVADRFRIPLVLAGHSGRAHVFGPVKAAPQDKYVRVAGPIADDLLPALYGGARAFVFPSLYEGFGIPPLEAAACGTPVIASDHPALREALGPAARYCDSSDSASIAGAISDVLSSAALREELAGLGSQRVRLFCWDRAASETWDILQRAA